MLGITGMPNALSYELVTVRIMTDHLSCLTTKDD